MVDSNRDSSRNAKHNWKVAGVSAFAGLFLAGPAQAAYEEELSNGYTQPPMITHAAYTEGGDGVSTSSSTSSSDISSSSGRHHGKSSSRTKKHRQRTSAHSARHASSGGHSASRSHSSRHASHAFGVSQSGHAASAAPVKALGRRVPFGYATQLITPNGWTVNNNVSSEARVSWKAGEPWTNVLSRAARKAGATASIDWDARTVTINKADGAHPAAVSRRGKGTPRSRAVSRANRRNGSGISSNGLVAMSAKEPGRGFLVKGMTAREAAQGLGLNEQQFCQWNSVGAAAYLYAGYAVWVQQPGTGALPLAESQAGGDSKPLPPYVPPTAGSPANTNMSEPMQTAPSRLESSAKDQTLSAGGSVPPAPMASSEIAEPDTFAGRTAYKLEPGTLISQVSRWCDQAGYQLVWKADRDVEIVSYVQYRGAFSRTLKNLFKDLAKAGQAFRVTVYESNRVVEVTDE